MQCRSCGNTETPKIVPRPDTVHAGGELRCSKCNSHMGWNKSNPTKKRTKTSNISIEALGINYCQLCLRPKRGLGIRQTLEIHHIVELDHGGEDRRSNIMVVCTSCHKLVHHIRLYHNEHMQHLWPAEVEEEVVNMEYCED